jgi:hypothetical protein
MARWMAIVALLLGMGLTAFESFSASTDHGGQVRIMEGGTPPPPPDRLTDSGVSTAPAESGTDNAVSSER